MTLTLENYGTKIPKIDHFGRLKIVIAKCNVNTSTGKTDVQPCLHFAIGNPAVMQ